MDGLRCPRPRAGLGRHSIRGLATLTAPRRCAPEQRLQTAIRVFRSVFDDQTAGWVDLLRFNDKLTVLRAHDGAWDLVWNDLRESAPPRKLAPTTSYVLRVTDRPNVILGEQDLARRLYFRRNVWEEREAHLAEQHFYDRGGPAEGRNEE